jgi:hypothetical protein
METTTFKRMIKMRSKRIQGVDWDPSSNRTPSVLEVFEDNRLEFWVSVLRLCFVLGNYRKFNSSRLITIWVIHYKTDISTSIIYLSTENREKDKNKPYQSTNVNRIHISMRFSLCNDFPHFSFHRKSGKKFEFPYKDKQE